MNYLKTLLYCVMAGMIGGAAVSIASPDPSVKSAAMSSVQLTKGGKGFCSGTFIEDPTGKNLRTILTARHCIDNVGEIVTVPYLGLKYDFTVEYVSDTSDLALLQSKSMFGATTATIARTPRYLEPSIAVGYPLGLSQTITQGFVGAIDTEAAFSEVSKSTAFLRSTTVIAPGSSGGGLYQVVDGKYQIVGVATGIHSKYFFVTYWTPTEEVNAFLESLS